MEILFVANAGDDSISLVSTSESRQIKAFAVEQKEPSRLIIYGGLLYCSNAQSGNISRMRPDGTKSIVRCSGANPQVMSVKNKKLYVICNESNSVWRYDTRGFIAETAAASDSWPVDMIEFGEGICVANMMSNKIICFDRDLHVTNSVELGFMPLCIADGFASGHKELIICGVSENEKGVFSCIGADGKTKFEITLPWPISAMKPLIDQPAGIALAVWDDRLCKFDWQRQKIVWQTKTGRMPESVLVDEKKGRIYVTCLQDHSIEVYDLNGQLRSKIPVGKEPRGMALCSGCNF